MSGVEQGDQRLECSAMIELHNVTRTYGRKTAVKDLTLRIPAGELFAFLGPNGAGKTTTIKMLTGLLQPSRGQVRVNGFDVVQSPREAAHSVGFVPDEPHLYDKLSGREFLQFVAELFAMPPSEAAEEIERQIKLFDLSTFVDHLTESYSHGMKQRLVFAAALVHRPKVLILDEPMVGLDPQNTRVVKNHLRQLVKTGVTIFMSTHTLSLAEEIADRIGVIYQGTLRFLGTVGELRTQLARDSHSLEQLFLELTSGGETNL
jgi:ABC-2 type transport system ATP-binding protein